MMYHHDPNSSWSENGREYARTSFTGGITSAAQGALLIAGSTTSSMLQSRESYTRSGVPARSQLAAHSMTNHTEDPNT